MDINHLAPLLMPLRTLPSTYSLERTANYGTIVLACLKETLRHYPPVAGNMPRTVPKGGAHIAGTFVPEGTSVGISQWSINHSTRNFSDPWSYKPERFLQPDQFKDDDFEALQPFSSGPRNCVGKK